MKFKIAISLTVLLVFLPFYSASSYRVQNKKSPYIILTTDSLLNSAKLFAQYRAKDFDVSIITISQIGSNNPDDIRSYLKKHYKKGYLLIIGSEKSIPRPAMYPSETEHNNSYDAPSKTETDCFYGFLSECIDRDNDGFPGEFWDDSIEFSPDLIVGRIPFDKADEVEKVFQNTVNFEKHPPQKAVLAASFISYPGEVYQGVKIFNGDGAREEEIIKSLIPVNTITLFNKSGDFPSIYNADLPLNKENFYKAISDSAFTDWVAHGNKDNAYNEIWIDKNHNGVPDDGYRFESFVSANDKFKASGIFFSGSCLNENGNENLGSALLEKGAVSFIGSTEISFSPSYFSDKDDGGTGSINYYFVKNLVSGDTVGKALYESFEYFFNNLLFNDIEDPVEGSLMDIYDYNIYGDPALKWHCEETKKDEGKTDQKSPVCIAVKDSKDISITLTVQNKENLFVKFPERNIVITDVSDGSAIIDNTFGIIRLNGASGSITIKGKVRGVLTGEIEVLDCSGSSSKNVKIDGYKMKDFNFDGIVDKNDFEMLLDSFGKTYMDETFNSICDLNFDHRVNGIDLFDFLLSGK